MMSHVLLIDCPDKEGLVFSITKVLFEHNVNIIRNGEYVDYSRSHFFMRTEFSGSFDSGRILDDLKQTLPERANITLTGNVKKKIVILATKEHHCLGDLLIRNSFNDLNSSILAVISNHQVLRDLTERFGIQFHYVSHENISREEHEKKVLALLQQMNPDYIILAKYMRILSPEFINEYSLRIINIHHSFLPAFVGANPYKQAYNRGVKIIGATAHFVNEKLDEGPIIAQGTLPVDHSFSDDDMAIAGKDIEKNVLANALALVFNDKVLVNGNKTIIL